LILIKKLEQATKSSHQMHRAIDWIAADEDSKNDVKKEKLKENVEDRRMKFIICLLFLSFWIRLSPSLSFP